MTGEPKREFSPLTLGVSYHLLTTGLPAGIDKNLFMLDTVKMMYSEPHK
jgi:hypothetical protein